MAYYLVGTNTRGYLPVGDPIECETLVEAKNCARQEAQFLAEETENRIAIWTPLNKITKRALMRDGVPTTYAVVGDVEVWITVCD